MAKYIELEKLEDLFGFYFAYANADNYRDRYPDKDTNPLLKLPAPAQLEIYNATDAVFAKIREFNETKNYSIIESGSYSDTIDDLHDLIGRPKFKLNEYITADNVSANGYTIDTLTKTRLHVVPSTAIVNAAKEKAIAWFKQAYGENGNLSFNDTNFHQYYALILLYLFRALKTEKAQENWFSSAAPNHARTLAQKRAITYDWMVLTEKPFFYQTNKGLLEGRFYRELCYSGHIRRGNETIYTSFIEPPTLTSDSELRYLRMVEKLRASGNAAQHDAKIDEWVSAVKRWNGSLNTKYPLVDDRALFAINVNNLPERMNADERDILNTIRTLIYDKKTNRLTIELSRPYNGTIHIKYAGDREFRPITVNNGTGVLENAIEPRWVTRLNVEIPRPLGETSDIRITLTGALYDPISLSDYKLAFAKEGAGVSYNREVSLDDLRDLVGLRLVHGIDNSILSRMSLSSKMRDVLASRTWAALKDLIVECIDNTKGQQNKYQEIISFLFGVPRFGGLTFDTLFSSSGTLQNGTKDNNELARRYRAALNLPVLTEAGFNKHYDAIYTPEQINVPALTEVFINHWNNKAENLILKIPRTNIGDVYTNLNRLFKQTKFLYDDSFLNRDSNTARLRDYHRQTQGALGDNTAGVIYSVDELVGFVDQGSAITQLAQLDQAQTDQNRLEFNRVRGLITTKIAEFNRVNGIYTTHEWYQDPTQVKDFVDTRPYPLIMPRDHFGNAEFDKPFGDKPWANHLQLILFYFNGGVSTEPQPFTRDEIVGPYQQHYANVVNYFRQYLDARSRGLETSVVEKALVDRVNDLISVLGNPIYKVDDQHVISLSTLFKPYHTKEELDAITTVNPAETHSQLIQRANRPYADPTPTLDGKYQQGIQTTFGLTGNNNAVLIEPVDQVGKVNQNLAYTLSAMLLSQAICGRYGSPLNFKEVQFNLAPWLTGPDELMALNDAYENYIRHVLKANVFQVYQSDIDSTKQTLRSFASQKRQVYDIQYKDGTYNAIHTIFREVPPISATGLPERQALVDKISAFEEDKKRYVTSPNIDTTLYQKLVSDAELLKTGILDHNGRFRIAEYYNGGYLQTTGRITVPDRRGATQGEYDSLQQRIRDYQARIAQPYTENNDVEYTTRVNLRRNLVNAIDVFVARYGYHEGDVYYISNDLPQPQRPRLFSTAELEKIRLLGERFTEVRRRFDRYKSMLIPPNIRWKKQNENDVWLANTYQEGYLAHNNFAGYAYLLEHSAEWEGKLEVIYTATVTFDVAGVIKGERDALMLDIQAYNRQLGIHMKSNNNNLYPGLLETYAALTIKINAYHDKFSLNDPTYAVYTDLKILPLKSPTENIGTKPLPQPLDIGKLVQYPFDSTGMLASNLVQETYVLTDENRNEFNYIIPRYAPFFSRSVVIEKLDTEDGNPLRLEENRDYMFGGYFGEITPFVSGKQRVEGIILFDDREITGTYRVTYQTLGGQYVLDITGYAAQIQNYLENPLLTSWGEIVGRPLQYPQAPHGHDFTDLEGVTAITNPIYALVEIYRQILEDEKSKGSGFEEMLEELASLRSLNRETRKEVSDTLIRVHEKYEEIKRLIRDGNVVIDNSAHDLDVEKQLSDFRKDIVKLLTDSLKGQDEKLSETLKQAVAEIDKKITALSTVIDSRIEEKLAEKNYIPYSATSPKKTLPNNVLRYTDKGELHLPKGGVVIGEKATDGTLTPVYQLDAENEGANPTVTVANPQKQKAQLPIHMKDYHYTGRGLRIKLGETMVDLISTLSSKVLPEVTSSLNAMDVVKQLVVKRCRGENNRGEVFGFAGSSAGHQELYFRYPKQYTDNAYTIANTVSYLDTTSSMALVVKALQELDTKITTHVNKNYVLTTEVGPAGAVRSNKILRVGNDQTIEGVKNLTFVNGNSRITATTTENCLVVPQVFATDYLTTLPGTNTKASLVKYALASANSLQLQENLGNIPAVTNSDALNRLATLPVYEGGSVGYRVKASDVRNKVGPLKQTDGIAHPYLNIEAFVGLNALAFKSVKSFQDDISAKYTALNAKLTNLPTSGQFILKKHLNKQIGHDNFKVPVIDGNSVTLASQVSLNSGVVLDTSSARLEVNHVVQAPEFKFTGANGAALLSASQYAYAAELGLVKPANEVTVVNANVNKTCYDLLKNVRLAGGPNVNSSPFALLTNNPANSKDRKHLTVDVGGGRHAHNAYQFDAMLLGGLWYTESSLSNSIQDVKKSLQRDIANLHNRLLPQDNDTDTREGRVVRLFGIDGHIGCGAIIFNESSGKRARMYTEYRSNDVYLDARFRPKEINLTSDKRLKEDIKPICDALNKILTLKGYTYKFKDEDYLSAGLLAQEVQAVLPEAVTKGDNGYLSLNYSAVIALLVNALSEQEAKLSDHEERLKRLEMLVDKL